MECKCCFNSIEMSNIVYYCDSDRYEWKISQYCYDCLTYMLDNNWKAYTDSIEKTECLAELRNMVKIGPPINIRDQNGLPCSNQSGEVYMFKYNKELINAKLNGSLVGIDRDKYWDDIKNRLRMVE